MINIHDELMVACEVAQQNKLLRWIVGQLLDQPELSPKDEGLHLSRREYADNLYFNQALYRLRGFWDGVRMDGMLGYLTEEQVCNDIIFIVERIVEDDAEPNP